MTTIIRSTILIILIITYTMGTQADTPHTPPNVVLILADDLGYGDLSSYGGEDIQTPHIDALMKQGMRFDQFYANSPVCSPTRAALLSGKYPDLAGVPGVIRTHQNNSWGHLSKEVLLLPAALKNTGYQTALIGKWHLGLEAPNRPTDHGFDYFHGWLGDMMDDYYTHRRHDINYMRRGEEVIEPQGHATDLFTDWSIDYIQKHSLSNQPYFLYLAYNAPHTPIQPPEDWLERVQQREPDITKNRAKLVALIEHMDHGIGRVMEAIEASGEKDNTLIIFTSDNGGQLNVGANNGELRDGKQSMYEGGLRVPMCAVWPKHIQPNTQSNQVATTMDLYPTITDLCQAIPGDSIDGISILPTLLGKEPELSDRTLFFMRREGGPRFGGQIYYAARQGDWKLIQNSPFEPMKLYNLKEDPTESTPLRKNHKMYRTLFQALQGQINQAGRIPWQR